MKTILITLTLSIFIFFSCTRKTESTAETEERTKIEMVTDYGTIILALYNETPKHRDNFIKLAKEGEFDSLLFHRVIEKFMIQGGDPDSKFAAPDDTLGSGGLPYRVDAEFHPQLFHKKGTLAAARDGNLERASSSMQFYIVQGRVYNDSTLAHAETRINGWLAEHYFKKDTANKALVDSLQKAMDDESWDRYTIYNDSIGSLAETYEKFERYTIPDTHREVYKTTGGTPHLDQNYTVYGEVIEGLEVVDSIAAVQTSPLNRPVKDVRIQSVRVID